MSEKQKGAIEVQEVGPLESIVLMGESQMGKALRASVPECLSLLLLSLFSSVWHDVNGHGKIPTAFNAV